MKIKCYFKECGYEWDYKGNNPIVVTCPRCYNKIFIRKLNRIKEENEKNQ